MRSEARRILGESPNAIFTSNSTTKLVSQQSLPTRIKISLSSGVYRQIRRHADFGIGFLPIDLAWIYPKPISLRGRVDTNLSSPIQENRRISSSERWWDDHRNTLLSRAIATSRALHDCQATLRMLSHRFSIGNTVLSKQYRSIRVKVPNTLLRPGLQKKIT